MLGMQTLTRKRYGAPTQNTSTGRFSLPAPTTSTLSASLQRPTAQQLQSLPEGERTLDQWYMDTETAVQTLNEVAGTMADRVTGGQLGALDYEVREVADESLSPLPHYEARIVRVQEGATP